MEKSGESNSNSSNQLGHQWDDLTKIKWEDRQKPQDLDSLLKSDETGDLDVNKLSDKIGRRQLVKQYAERVVYVNERGREETMLLNPWEMLKYVESPDELYIVGREFIKVSSNMAKNEEILESRNHGKLQLRKGNDEFGYQPMMPEQVADDSELGKFLSKISKGIEDRINKS